MKASLRILMICKSMPWRFKGGIQTHTWELAKAMVKSGHEVTIVTGGAFRKARQSYQKEGVSIVEIPFFPGRYLKPIAMIAEEYSFNWAVFRWIKANVSDFDIIHAQGRSGYLVPFCREARRKMITTFHGILLHENAHAKWYHFNGKIHSWVTRFFERHLLKSSAARIAVSNQLKKDISDHFLSREQVYTIPNGVNIKSDWRTTTDEHEGFLFIGRLHAVKGIHRLVEELAHHPDLKLDIIGDGELKRTLEAIIEKHNLQNQVRLLGERTNEGIHELIPDYRALILPSSYETQGIVLLEAHAHAVPVIASDIPSIRESVEHEHNGLLCDPNDMTTFINAMKRIKSEPELGTIMGIKGRIKVMGNYSWEHIAHETLDVYQKLAS